MTEAISGVGEEEGVYKKVYIRISKKFTGKHLCWSLFFKNVAGKPSAQVFLCEFCENFKKVYFAEHLQTAAYFMDMKYM